MPTITAAVARERAESTACSTPAASNAASTPWPLVRSAMRAGTSWFAGSSVRAPSASIEARRTGEGLDHVDLGQAHPAQGEPDADADRACAEDQRTALVADFSQDRRVVCHRHGLDQRAHLQRHAVRQLVHLVARNHRVLRHAAVRHEPVEPDDLAQVVPAGPARAALAAPVHRFDRDPVALAHACHPGADFRDRAGEFMPQDERHVPAGERVRFGRRDEDRTVEILVQVRAADAVAADPHLDLPRPGGRLRHVLDLQLVVAVVDGSAHGSSRVTRTAPPTACTMLACPAGDGVF